MQNIYAILPEHELHPDNFPTTFGLDADGRWAANAHFASTLCKYGIPWSFDGCDGDGWGVWFCGFLTLQLEIDCMIKLIPSVAYILLRHSFKKLLWQELQYICVYFRCLD